MRPCRRYRKIFVEILYNGLGPAQRLEFETHLEECPRCQEAHARFASTLGIMDQRRRPEPGKAFWASYLERLTKRMDKESRSVREPVVARHRTYGFRIRPIWAVPIAAAACLILGIWLGKYAFHGSAADRRADMEPRTGSLAESSTADSGIMASLRTRTDEYFERSKVLLLGIVNFDAEAEDPNALNLPRKREISRDLVREAGSLKEEWSSVNSDKKLVELISDLEVILLQIANLESNHDLPAVEIVKSGVDRRGILLKINIEAMRRSNADDPRRTPKESETLTKEKRT